MLASALVSGLVIFVGLVAFMFRMPPRLIIGICRHRVVVDVSLWVGLHAMILAFSQSFEALLTASTLAIITTLFLELNHKLILVPKLVLHKSKKETRVCKKRESLSTHRGELVTWIKKRHSLERDIFRLERYIEEAEPV